MNTLLKEKHGGVFYSVCVIGTVIASLVLSILNTSMGGTLLETDVGLYLAFLATQVLYAVALVGFFLKTKVNVREVGVRGCAPKYFLIAILLQFGLMFALGKANETFIGLLGDLFGYEAKETPLPSLDGMGIVGVTLAVALLPAVCEELVFRGVILNSIKKMGVLFSVLVCGGLFALFHMNPAQTVYQFCCGAVFALIAYRSGSVLPTMLVHFLNNFIIILSAKFGWVFEGTWYTVLTIVSALCLIAGLALLILDKKQEKQRGDVKGFFLGGAVGIIICLVFWISGFMG